MTSQMNTIVSTNVSPRINEVGNVIEKVNHGYQTCLDTLKGLSSSVAKGVGEALNVAGKVVVWKQIASIALAPIQLVAFGKQCHEMTHGTREQRIDAAFAASNTVRDMGASTGSFVMGLQGLEKMSTSTRWILPFAGAMSIFSVFSIIGNLRTSSKMRTLLTEVEGLQRKHQEPTQMLASFRSIVSMLKHKQKENNRFFSNTFHATEQQMNEALDAIDKQAETDLTSTDAQQRAKGEKALKNALDALKGRIKANISNSRVSAVAAIINLIGTAVLFVCPFAGMALWGLSALIDTGNWIYNKVNDRSFGNALGLKRSRWQLLTC